MNAAHTPGPWPVRATPESSYGDFAVQIGRDYVSLFNEADAHLIGAAPDLLEQARCNSGILLALSLHLEGVVSAKVCADIKARIEKTNAAILAATGGAA